MIGTKYGVPYNRVLCTLEEWNSKIYCKMKQQSVKECQLLFLKMYVFLCVEEVQEE